VKEHRWVRTDTTEKTEYFCLGCEIKVQGTGNGPYLHAVKLSEITVCAPIPPEQRIYYTEERIVFTETS